jgi:hypothetical protein
VAASKGEKETRKEQQNINFPHRSNVSKIRVHEGIPAQCGKGLNRFGDSLRG